LLPDDDPLDDLLRVAARRATDPAARAWLNGLLERGERAEGVAGRSRTTADAATADSLADDSPAQP
jgi:hypothetical protein